MRDNYGTKLAQFCKYRSSGSLSSISSVDVDLIKGLLKESEGGAAIGLAKGMHMHARFVGSIIYFYLVFNQTNLFSLISLSTPSPIIPLLKGSVRRDGKVS